MQKLIDGVHRFQANEFGRYSQLFHKLSCEGQKPHTLFITCADSRILAELITQSQPGDLFVVKNIGNIVPPQSATGTTNSTAAAIEYAVSEIEVNDVVICGHSQCGAIATLLSDDPSKLEGPEKRHLRSWLTVAAPVRQVVDESYGHLMDNPDALMNAAAEENVLFAMENLRSYPGVARRVADGTLRLHAWFFKIATAELFSYDPEARQFAPLVKAEDRAACS